MRRSTIFEQKCHLLGWMKIEKSSELIVLNNKLNKDGSKSKTNKSSQSCSHEYWKGYENL